MTTKDLAVNPLPVPMVGQDRTLKNFSRSGILRPGFRAVKAEQANLEVVLADTSLEVTMEDHLVVLVKTVPVLQRPNVG